MKHSNGYTRPTALLGCVLLGVSALNAVAQAPGRRSVPFRSASTATTASTSAPAGVFGTYPQSPNATAAQTGIATVGTVPTSPAQQGTGGTQTSQIPDIITVQHTTANELAVQWSGNVPRVTQISLGVFDSNGKILDRKDFTQLPVQAHFTLTSAATHYGVQIQRANSATTTVYQPLE